MHTPPSPYLFVLLAVAFGFFSSIALVAGVPDFKKALAAKRWPHARARIITAEEVTEVSRSGSRRRLQRGYKIRYEYTAEGSAVQGHWDSVLSSSTQPGSCRFKAGDSVDVCVNPLDATDSRLFPKLTVEDWLPVIAGTIFGLVSLGSLAGLVVRLTV